MLIVVVIEKSIIKGNVMSYEIFVSQKFTKCWEDFTDEGSVCNHFVCDSGQLFDSFGNMSFWIDEGVELFNDIFSIKFDCGDFGDSVSVRMESCGF